MRETMQVNPIMQQQYYHNSRKESSIIYGIGAAGRKERPFAPAAE
jgi:hypothetical protein